jgi:hypothetical protein
MLINYADKAVIGLSSGQIMSELHRWFEASRTSLPAATEVAAVSETAAKK